MRLLFLVALLLLAGCEIELPAVFQEMSTLQSAIATDLDVEPDLVNVSTTMGDAGTTLQITLQNAEIGLPDETLCDRIVQTVGTSFPSADQVARVAVVSATRKGIGPVGATASRTVCVVERTTPPSEMDSLSAPVPAESAESPLP